MNWPRYKPGPVEYWCTEAGTQFINGFIAGWKPAVGVGAGTGAVTGMNQDIANNITAGQQIIVSAATIALSMFFSGTNQFIRWHETNPFPNPFPKPTGTTQPPFPTP